MEIKAKPRIFIVDDHDALRHSLRKLFEAEAFEVEDYDCAEEFLISHDPPLHGCLLLDVHLPGMSGLDLLASKLAYDDELAIVMISGDADAAGVVRAFKSGAADFFQKPFDPRLLLQRVRQLIETNARHERQLGIPGSVPLGLRDMALNYALEDPA